MDSKDLTKALHSALMEADGLRETGDELAAARCEHDLTGLIKQGEDLGLSSLLLADAKDRQRAATQILRLIEE